MKGAVVNLSVSSDLIPQTEERGEETQIFCQLFAHLWALQCTFPQKNYTFDKWVVSIYTNLKSK
jgi:hypothetical protein